MALFIVLHEHQPHDCPASPQSGLILSACISAAAAACYGVAIQAEAVISDAHRLVLVVEAAEQVQVERFMASLGRYGSVLVLPASSTEAAVARGSCVMPDASGAVFPPGAANDAWDAYAVQQPGVSPEEEYRMQERT